MKSRFKATLQARSSPYAAGCLVLLLVTLVTTDVGADPIAVDEGKAPRFVGRKKREYRVDTQKLEREHESRCGPVPLEKPLVEAPPIEVLDYRLEQVIPDGGNNVNPFDFVSVLAFLEGDRRTFSSPILSSSAPPPPVSGACTGSALSITEGSVDSTTGRVCVFIDDTAFPTVSIRLAPSGGGLTISFLLIDDPPDNVIRLLRTGIVTSTLDPPSGTGLRSNSNGTTTHRITVRTTKDHVYCLNFQITVSGSVLSARLLEAVTVQ